jgi:hypothetical protein
MEATRKTIGLSDLLDEIGNDLDELRKKHPSDYTVKNITMWWELERERLVSRHGSSLAVRKHRWSKNLKRLTISFIAGWIVSIAVIVGSRLLVP